MGGLSKTSLADGLDAACSGLLETCCKMSPRIEQASNATIRVCTSSSWVPHPLSQDKFRSHRCSRNEHKFRSHRCSRTRWFNGSSTKYGEGVLKHNKIYNWHAWHEKGGRFRHRKSYGICSQFLTSWWAWTNEVHIEVLSICVAYGLRAHTHFAQTMYFVKWQIRVLQIHRRERMMMLQENSRLADLRLVACFIWPVGH